MTADGMPSNSVYDIAQHESGMMWFITNAGPTYYDSKEWHFFPDSLELPTSNNSKIVVSDSIVWVAGLNKTNFTVQYYNNEWVKLEVPFESKSFEKHIAFNVFKTDNNHTVIIGANSSLFIYELSQNKWSKIDTNGMSINSIHSQMGNRIICTSKGVWAMNGDSLALTNLPYSKFPSTNILTCNYKKGITYLLGFNWYAEIENGEITFMLDDVGLISSSLVNQSSLIVDQNDNVFFGSSTPARMINHENKTWQNLLIKGENMNIGSTSIYCDIENNLWVSDARGLFKFNVLQFLSYNKSSGLASDEVTAVTQLSDGTMLIANPYDFNLIKDDKITQYNYKIEKSLNYRILSVEIDSANNRLYMATNDPGLLVYEIGHYEKPILIFSGEKSRITSVKKFKGSIYATSDHGIHIVEGDRIKEIIPYFNIRNISNLGERLAFLSNRDGVFIYDGNTFYHYNSDNYDLNSVYQAVVFNGDTILATRAGPGIIEDEAIKYWDQVAINSPTYGLLVDSKNQLWIGSDRGIYLYDGETLQLFDVNQGLAGNEINRNALFEDSNGQVWIGTEKGVSIYKPDDQLKNKLNLSINITGVNTDDGTSLSDYPKNTLPFDQNNIHVTFNCLSYVDEEKLNYRYRIDPSSDTWIENAEATNRISFSNLKPGDYQFEIQARFNLADWGPVSKVNFSIQKPFYIQWWFIIISILLLLIVGRIIFYFRYLFLIKKQKKLKEMVASRTKEIRQLNEQLEEKVLERTKELNDKNLKLEETAYVNAHYLRGPLTKIMSALQIAENDQGDVLDTNIIKILKESTEELDNVIHSINEILRE